MKKICACILSIALLICLFGCSGSSGDKSGEITISFDFGDRAGMYDGSLDDDGLPDGAGTFSSQTSAGECWTYAGDWDHGHWNGIGISKWESGKSYCGSYENDAESGYGVFTYPDERVEIGEFANGILDGYGIISSDDGATIVGNFSQGELDGYSAIYLPDGSVFFGKFSDSEAEGTIFLPDGSEAKASYSGNALHYDPNDLIKVEDQNDNVEETISESNQEVCGFFSNDEIRCVCRDLLQECKYSDLYSYLSKTVSVADLDPDDIVFDIMDKTERLSELAKKCDAETDKIEGTTSIFYSGLKDITSKANIIPSLQTNSYFGISIEYKIGFRKNDWLFFDRVTIVDGHSNKNEMHFDRLDVNTDIISGSTIQESAYIYDLGSDITIDHESNITIRFKNADSREYIDHEFTDMEISAIETLSEIRNLHSSIFLKLKD